MKRFRHIAWLLLIGLNSINLNAQISPGELSDAHKQLEGISNCNKCHLLGKKVNSQKCLECHKEINQLILDKKGYHSSLEVNGKECFDCHSEHHGRNFTLVRFDTTSFDHQLAGYELKGKHKTLNCAACHKPELVRVHSSQKKSTGYLGLGTLCLSCHKDYHQNTLPQDCFQCHTNDGFKPATLFNHNKTNFILKGKHQQVKCELCHKVGERNGQKFQQFSQLEYENCVACHKDVHNNRLGQDCKSCHNEESFHAVRKLSNFNHARTGYPLVGKHEILDCKECHKSSYTTKIKHDLCKDCHEDYHKNQFNTSGSSLNCSDCHSEFGFSPSQYSIQRHNETGFSLHGAHLATPCIACHKKSEEWNFDIDGNGCIKCHENIHKQELDSRFVNQNCKPCHTTNTWKEIEFDHNLTEFKLLGKHAEQSCRKCHFKTDLQSSELQMFKSLTADCLNCHTDEHGGQFSDNLPLCTSCHVFTDWKPILFNHDNARFKLDGKHKDLECSKCHKPTSGLEKSFILYKNNKLKCTDCHS